jgi:isopentenyl diphosphate isomerase/L-lactate dehydrogenase-like FMN-dependent dehydrogenase
MILSTDASTAVEEVNAAYGRPVWYQLYPTDDWNVTRGLIKRVAHAGCPALVLTVDLQGESNRETAERGKRSDTRDCNACHIGGFSSAALARRHPMFAGLDVSAITSYSATYATWEFIDRLRRETTMKLLVKGIVTHEDAELAVLHGVDGVIVSNHGGRADDTGRSTIECLPEVIEGVRGRVPVLIDSGFRRGTDVFKALALGATAVGIGRPYLWGLAAFGQPGVEAVLDILDRELAMTMRQAGTVDRSAITRAYVTPTA